jgi:Mg2+/Co2+ transporter CorB
MSLVLNAERLVIFKEIVEWGQQRGLIHLEEVLEEVELLSEAEEEVDGSVNDRRQATNVSSVDSMVTIRGIAHFEMARVTALK